MRNIFDQYDTPENRLTHALLTCLDQDRNLLDGFVAWVLDNRAPTPAQQLKVLEQGLPDQEEGDPGPAESKGLPDGCIYDNRGWGLLIESKIAAPLKVDQLKRHIRTAEGRGIIRPNLVALVASLPGTVPQGLAKVRRWTDLYLWLRNQDRKSEWTGRLIAYMEVLESKLPRDQYLTGGTLTVFSGIPFGKDNPYGYLEAKRVLRLAMDELRSRSDLQRELGVDKRALGRSAITGRDSTRVWDFLRLLNAEGAKSFTEFPHLTLAIHQQYLEAMVTVPNGIRGAFRRGLLDGGMEGFRALFESILMSFSASLGRVEGAVPWVQVLQRRYRTQRSEPFIDAKLEYDLRTGFGNSSRGGKPTKHQPQWLEASYESLSCKIQTSNLWWEPNSISSDAPKRASLRY
ncbi:MAG: hypothetical protein WDM87_10915 [Terracidiphilus sp.]